MARNVVSARKLAANRANALRSTGPRTPAGKARSRRNALKSGVLATKLLVPPEDRAYVARLHADIRAEIQPASPVEEHLVNRFVDIAWRLQLIVRYENRGVQERLRALAANPDHRAPQPATPNAHFNTMMRCESFLNRVFHETLNRFNAIARSRRLSPDRARFDLWALSRRLHADATRDAQETRRRKTNPLSSKTVPAPALSKPPRRQAVSPDLHRPLHAPDTPTTTAHMPNPASTRTQPATRPPHPRQHAQRQPPTDADTSATSRYIPVRAAQLPKAPETSIHRIGR